MKYGRDFDDGLWIFMLCVGSVISVYGILRSLQKLDKSDVGGDSAEKENKRSCSIMIQLCLCLLSGEAVYCCGKQQWTRQGLFAYMTLLSVAAAALTAAVVMDLESCMVYNYVWWIGGGAAVLLLGMVKGGMEGELLIFILLQELFFCRLYGRADCHAFSVCAFLENVMGMGMQMYLLHMLFAFLLLALVQGVGGNIGTNGNLKQPVAFLPYITLTFWGVLLG